MQGLFFIVYFFGLFCILQVGSASHGAHRGVPLHADHVPGLRQACGQDGTCSTTRCETMQISVVVLLDGVPSF